MALERRTGEAGDAVKAAAGAGLDPKGVAAFALSVAFPGVGYLMLKRWKRGVTVALVLGAAFAAGLFLQGRLYVPERSNLLSLIFSFADFGMAIPYSVCLLGNIGFAIQAQAPTFEYGTNLLAVAGLLNYLVALDAYDIAVGRKQ